jgi:hypothetical protein
MALNSTASTATDINADGIASSVGRGHDAGTVGITLQFAAKVAHVVTNQGGVAHARRIVPNFLQ